MSKKYKCELMQSAEGTTTGFIMLTKEEYETVKRVSDYNNWEHLDYESWCGGFFISCEELDRQISDTDTIPISFIKEKMEELQEISDYESTANGGYVTEAECRLWELQDLLKAWSEKNTKYELGDDLSNAIAKAVAERKL